jgi:hypothetical protein
MGVMAMPNLVAVLMHIHTYMHPYIQVVTSTEFSYLMGAVVMANLVALAVESHQMSHTQNALIEATNYIFCSIYGAEVRLCRG